MSRVLERRRTFLRLIRQFTLDAGSFTVHDLADAAAVPRSTAQDWINRLIEERCILLLEEKRGRQAARYAATSVIPSSTCRRIFTTLDGDRVEIYHECMSGGCAAFCEFHHRQAEGVLVGVKRDGALLRESARLGMEEVEIGPYPSPAVGVRGVERRGDWIVQHIRCFGGPAYSLTEMMSRARGVCDVRIRRIGNIVEGEIYTRALVHVAIGIDDTDSAEEGATFALALALLQHLGGMEGIIPIGHRVVMLYPYLPEKTAGNSCSCIDLAVEPARQDRILDRAQRFVEDEVISAEWGIAVKCGFIVPPPLRDFGMQVRRGRVERADAERVARDHGIQLCGGRGVIGALAAVALRDLDTAALLDPMQNSARP
ncbi:MAG: sugar-specific transcriptional regulator TrmB [Methanomicrobiales archaeon]|nr:sugar-specific transcriptional regulator TrmB [Methanomicrobiales archaeon]